ncbi:MAG: hypothetical protein ABGX83_11130 [Nitrospira sp.]|nr:hypothetical protein [Candidatus Manganitrophaceae bacterium]HIL34617.1 hypothetical protein [Candidatus Manganitrophaceae bacterium]
MRRSKTFYKHPLLMTGALLLFFSVVGFSGLGFAAEGSTLSVSYTIGTYQPSLDGLNKVLGDPGRGILQDPNYLLPRSRLLPAEARNIVTPEIAGNINYGLEVEWKAKARISLVGTLSLWTGESQASDTVSLFLRQDFPPRKFSRTARYDLSITQIWLGWKYDLFHDPEQGRFFINIGLIGISIANLTMDAIVRVDANDIDPDLVFTSISSTEARGVAFTSRLGVGGEYFVTEWFSFGVNANYVIGSSSRIKVRRHFRSGFSDVPPPPSETTDLGNVPPVPENGDLITEANIRSQNISDFCDPGDDIGGCGRGSGRPLELDLNGFQVNAAFRFYF